MSVVDKIHWLVTHCNGCDIISNELRVDLVVVYYRGGFFIGLIEEGFNGENIIGQNSYWRDIEINSSFIEQKVGMRCASTCKRTKSSKKRKEPMHVSPNRQLANLWKIHVWAQYELEFDVLYQCFSKFPFLWPFLYGTAKTTTTFTVKKKH